MIDTSTPRTDYLLSGYVTIDQLINHARKLERELTAVTEQRDEARRLAERYRDLSCDTLEEADETMLPWENAKSAATGSERNAHE
jgi:hypothetical protein